MAQTRRGNQKLTRPSAGLVALLGTLLFVVGTNATMGADWKIAHGKLLSPWAAEVSPSNAHPEYPRPTMVRSKWMNLNGLWNYALVDDSAVPRVFADQILVPFPMESALSGVAKRVATKQSLWYRRAFTIPATWLGQRVLLHFGAVDWDARVRVNGKEIGRHLGGYDPFHFDITDALNTNGENELVVVVNDPTDAGYQARGKQVQRPEGIWYTPTTGIWQTVWLEPVPDSYIQSLHVMPDVDGQCLRVEVVHSGPNARLDVRAIEGANQPRQGREIRANNTEQLRRATWEIPLPNAKLWTPDNPFLYDLEITLTENGKLLDHIRGYAGMRKISVGKDDAGHLRLLLNNRPLFQFGPLDQGFWPDGLYTAPNDAALRYDLEITKKMGFNMVRKHVKVEPERWYWWCDRLGLLVWQDMPSGERSAPWEPNGKFDGQEIRRSKESADQFNQELAALIAARRNHPCIVVWVPFNEAWGQFDTVRVGEWIKKQDPSRLVNAASGGNDFPVGDIRDLHRYPGPAMPKLDGQRVAVLGEFGGLGLPLEGHTWLSKGNWGYRSFNSQPELQSAYLGLIAALRPMIGKGLAAAVYTQTTDVEVEINGLMTYDRKVIKLDVEKVATAHRLLYLPPPIEKTILPDSRQAGQIWRYTTKKPAEAWSHTEFDDKNWQSGPGGLGTPMTPGIPVRTRWDTPDIWMRRVVELPKLQGRNLHLTVYHDEDAEIFINGELAAVVKGYVTDYVAIPLTDAALQALRPGKNTIAVHCHQTGGGQGIDVGLVEIIERTNHEPAR